jgi:hypothetical protein
VMSSRLSILGALAARDFATLSDMKLAVCQLLTPTTSFVNTSIKALYQAEPVLMCKSHTFTSLVGV